MDYKIAVCDDSAEDQNYIMDLARQWAGTKQYTIQADAFPSAESFLFHYAEHKDYDILLLDIEMGDMDGVSLAKRLRKDNERIQIIFVTGFPDFMAEGYEVSALHYLLKPVDAGGIFYVEALAHFCRINTTKGAFEVRQNFSELEKKLGEGFIRTHRSYLVRVSGIRRIAKSVMVDAILNSKLSLLKAKDIQVNAKAVVPSALQISEIALCVIIGNLLDNAMEACLRQTEGEDRFIRLFIGILKDQLYVSVSNSAYGELKKEGKTYLSTKKSAGHGFGLMRVDRIVKKYDGYINRQNEEGVFATEIMLPL